MQSVTVALGARPPILRSIVHLRYDFVVSHGLLATHSHNS